MKKNPVVILEEYHDMCLFNILLILLIAKLQQLLVTTIYKETDDTSASVQYAWTQKGCKSSRKKNLQFVSGSISASVSYSSTNCLLVSSYWLLRTGINEEGFFSVNQDGRKTPSDCWLIRLNKNEGKTTRVLSRFLPFQLTMFSHLSRFLQR